MSNRKVKKNKAKKKTTNYKQLGAVGLGGTFLGALATRGMFDRKQLLNIKDCDEKIKQMKDDCAKNRQSLIKSNEDHNNVLALANEQLKQELNRIKNFLNNNKSLGDEIEKLRKKNIEFENSIKALDSQNNDLALANKYLQQELEKCKAEKEMLKKWFGISYDDDLGAKPKFTYEVRKKEFGRKRIKSKVKKIPSSLKKKCKRLKVRLTTKRGGKRVYKSIKVLKKQCSNKIKKKY